MKGLLSQSLRLSAGGARPLLSPPRPAVGSGGAAQGPLDKLVPPSGSLPPLLLNCLRIPRSRRLISVVGDDRATVNQAILCWVIMNRREEADHGMHALSGLDG